MSSKNLFDDDESEEELVKPKLNTNTEYAKKYDEWRKKELLHKLKAKYGEDPLMEDSESSSSSDDDEDGVFLNDKFNQGFYKVLAALKTKDPKIYQKDVKFFEEDDNQIEQPKKKKKKDDKELPFDAYTGEVLKQQASESTEENNQQNKKKNMEEDLKKLMEVDSDDDDDPFNTNSDEKEKTKEGKSAAGSQNFVDEKKVLENLFKKKAGSKEEQFLYDYIIADGPKDDVVYDDTDDHTRKIVDYSDDDEVDAKQEEYEHKYNFRFEEPDPEFIKRYPRIIENSMRLKDDKRKVKRQEVKERKQREKEQKMEEIRQLQALKLNEIEEKIRKLKEVTGKNDLELKEEDIDGDFDPEEHDRKMQALFNDEFYQGPEEEYKPEFPELDEELEIENWNKWKGEKIEGEDEAEGEENEPHCEDDNFNMDCDYDPLSTQKEIVESTRGKKKRKRKSKFAQVLGQNRPVFDPNDKSYEQYLDEYYKLDCEDIIGDIPCRFKYRQTVPNSFGLTIEEILAANDKELNKWCSIKKAMALRPDHVEKYDVIAYQRKGQNTDLKKKILPSLFEEPETKNKNKQKNGTQNVSNENNQQKQQDADNLEIKQSKKKKKKSNKQQEVTENEEEFNKCNENTLIAAEEESSTNNGKKKKRKNKELIENENIEEINNVENEAETTSVKTNKNKKKKHKNKQENGEAIEEGNNVEEQQGNEDDVVPKKKKNKKDKVVENEVEDVSLENVGISKKQKKQKQKQNENGMEQKQGKKQKHDFGANNKLKNKRKKQNDDNPMGISDERLKAYGLNPKKFKNKLKYKK